MRRRIMSDPIEHCTFCGSYSLSQTAEHNAQCPFHHKAKPPDARRAAAMALLGLTDDGDDS